MALCWHTNVRNLVEQKFPAVPALSVKEKSDIIAIIFLFTLFYFIFLFLSPNFPIYLSTINWPDTTATVSMKRESREN